MIPSRVNPAASSAPAFAGTEAPDEPKPPRALQPRPGQGDLISGAIGPTLLAFALPTLGSNILQSLNGSINAVWVGRFLGEEALAATSNANIIMFLMFSTVFGFGMAATILVGQSIGRGDLAGAKRAFGSAVGFVFGAAVVIAALGYIFAPDILRALATPPAALAFANDYLRVIFLGLPASMLLILLMMGLRGAGDSMTPFWFMVLSVVLDAGLNPVFILGLGHAPALGIAGSATATLVANHAAVIGLTAFVYLRNLPLKFATDELRYLIPDPALLRTIIAKGLPIAAQMLVISTASLAMLGLVNREGVAVSAAYGITQQLWAYVQLPAMAIGAAVSAMAAQNIGAGRWDRVGQITLSGMFYNLLITGSTVILLLIFDREVMALFVGADSIALPIARHIQLIATWGFVLFGLTMVMFGTVRANGAVLVPLIVLFIGMYPVRVGSALLLHPALGADALWWSFPLGSSVTLVLAALYYRYGNWRGGATKPPVHAQECQAQAQADAEPRASVNPAG